MARAGRLAQWVLAILFATEEAYAQSVPAGDGPESTALASLRDAERDDDTVQRGGGTLSAAAQLAGTSLGDVADLDPTVAVQIHMPSILARMSPRLARAVGLFLHDARARSVLTSWVRRASRYRERMESILTAEGVPTELVWVAAAESGFDPRSSSEVGAGGPWQLMPSSARTYGLRVDTWVDERLDPDRSTHAAARYLRDLYTRFGTWELALAAYNMGYNALLRSVRKYNTNDFDTLADLEAGLPWETVHYVPRILAAAIATTNDTVFGLDRVSRDPVATWEDVPVAESVDLADIVRATGVSQASLRALNPALVRTRTPVPADGAGAYVLHVPVGARDTVLSALNQMHPAPTRAYTVRYGETLDEIATRYGLRPRALLALSGIVDDHGVGQGEVLLTPDREPVDPVPTALPVVPMDTPEDVPTGLSRVFVRVVHPDDLATAATALGVSRGDLARWNSLDPGARLQPGMWLQAWVSADRSATARVWRESDVELVRRGSEFFHDHAVAAAGLVRLRVTVRPGDTLDTLATRFATTVGRLARINHRDRHASLTPGEAIVVYTDPVHAGVDANGNPASPDDHTASVR